MPDTLCFLILFLASNQETLLSEDELDQFIFKEVNPHHHRLVSFFDCLTTDM
jgi:hypothetical protein